MAIYSEDGSLGGRAAPSRSRFGRAGVEIRPAGAADIPALRELFREYAEIVGEALCFQAYDEEIANLPGQYAPPEGMILVAATSETLAACVAMRPLSPGVCEMKRLFVRPAFRGLGLGRRLTEEILAHAGALGYEVLRLDTLPKLDAAIALYHALGFQVIPPYSGTPTAICFEKLLKSV